MAPKRTGHRLLGCVDSAGGGVVSCVMNRFCGWFGNGVNVVAGDGSGGRDGRRLLLFGKGTTAMGKDCE